MSEVNEHFGWLGSDAEKRAFSEARIAEERRCSDYDDEHNGRVFHFHEYDEIADFLPPLMLYFKNRLFTWDLERRLFVAEKLPYTLIPTLKQDTGNCVAASLAGAGQKLQMLEIALGGEEEDFREWFVPWIYAISRNQIGRGKLGRGAGSTGAWGARAVNEYGVLFSDDEEVPGYTGTSDKWGSSQNARNIETSEYGKFVSIAKDNPVEIVRCTSIEQMTGVLDAGMQVTIASSQGFKTQTYKGLHIYIPSGTWYHQMHITDLRRDPELMFYRMNQWGEGHTKPLNEETPGGAWYRASDLDDEITRKSVEIYGYNKFQGSPGKADFSLV